MPLPDYKRVIYSKNPLEEVICQVRFPSILRIDTELPAAFQEALRGQYPLYEEKTQKGNMPEIPPAVANLLPPGWPVGQPQRVYVFASTDNRWVITLARDALSLTTKRYERWEEFRERLEKLLGVLVKQYGPPFYSRVGLRYQDVIRPWKLELDKVSWGELLTPHISGELACTELKDEIEQVVRQLKIRFNEKDGHVLVRHGLAVDTDKKKDCFLIDCDYFRSERTETNDAIGILNYFNHQAGRLFRWCITQRLHNAMAPRPL